MSRNTNGSTGYPYDPSVIVYRTSYEWPNGAGCTTTERYGDGREYEHWYFKSVDGKEVRVDVPGVKNILFF